MNFVRSRFVFSAAALIALAACSQQNQSAGGTAPTTIAAPIEPEKTDLPAGTYTLDKAHASLLFRVDHLGFSNYTARFTTWDATLNIDPADPTTAMLDVTIDPNSLQVENPPPGFLKDLLGENWLDTKKYPELNFRATAITLTAPNMADIVGELTLHGVTKPVTLHATFNGGYAGHPMDPHARVGFSATGAFNRSDFGMGYGVPAPGTKMGVSDEVNIIVESEFSGPEWTAPEGEGATP